jgi:hypothetical protein
VHFIKLLVFRSENIKNHGETETGGEGGGEGGGGECDKQGKQDKM